MTKHVVIASYGSSGDIFPFVEMGKYLVANDYDVSFITTSWFEHTVTTGGMRYVPFGTIGQAVDLLNEPAIWHPVKGLNVIWKKAIQPNLHTIRLHLQTLKDDEVVVLCNPLMMPLADLARTERPNLKVALFYLQPSAMRTAYGRVTVGSMTLPKCPRPLAKALYSVFDRLFFDAGIVPDLNSERAAVGLAPIGHFRPYLCSGADAYVTLFPEWYGPRQPDYPTPLIPGDFILHAPSSDPLSDELTRFLDAGQPPILFTAGTPTRHLERFFQIAADVVTQLNARGIFLTGFREQLPRDLPSSVLWQTYVPFDRCLPRLSVIVHHGGMGTFAEASRAGIPQLIVPFAHDHFENARIIRGLGIGASMPLRSLTKRGLASRLARLQGSKKVHDRCLSIASKFGSRREAGQIVDDVFAAMTGSPARDTTRAATPEIDALWELLNAAASKGLKLSVDGDRLNCYAPKGALTSELKDSIRRNKSRLIVALGSKSHPAGLPQR